MIDSPRVQPETYSATKTIERKSIHNHRLHRVRLWRAIKKSFLFSIFISLHQHQMQKKSFSFKYKL